MPPGFPTREACCEERGSGGEDAFQGWERSSRLLCPHPTVRHRPGRTFVRSYDSHPETAAIQTLATTGSALLGSALTTALGFAVLTLSPLRSFEQFGITAAITIIYALIVSTLVVPPAMTVGAPTRTCGCARWWSACGTISTSPSRTRTGATSKTRARHRTVSESRSPEAADPDGMAYGAARAAERAS